jgi:uncharacterized protein with HEPN domain
MLRDYRLYLAEIEDACRKIIEFTSDMSGDDFKQDQLRADAVLMNLMMIGEAVKNIPEDVREQFPSIEWKKIAGLRDMIVHVYFAINLEIIWGIVQNHVPALLEAVSNMPGPEE